MTLSNDTIPQCEACGNAVDYEGQCGCPVGDDRLIAYQARELGRFKKALNDAWGEAYLGALIGDDTPDPLNACLNVIDVCHKAFQESANALLGGTS